MARILALTLWLRQLFPPNSISRMALSIYMLQAITVMLGLINNIVIARILQPADKGIYDIFLLIMQLTVDLSMLGIGSGLLYSLANRGQSLAKVHGTGLGFSVAMGSAVVLIGWLFLPLWRKLFLGIDSWIIIVGFMMAVVGMYTLISSYLNIGINRPVTNYRVRLLGAVLFLGPSLGGFVFFDYGVKEFIILRVVINIIMVVVAFGLLYRQQPALEPDWNLLKQSLRYGMVIYAGYIANLLHYRVDQLMLNALVGSTAVGIYSVSVRWAEMLFLLDSAIGESALYRISSLPADESHRLASRLFKIQLGVSLGGALGLAVITYPMITVLYGDSFKDSIMPLWILIPGVTMWSVSRLFSMHLSYNRGLFFLPVIVSVIGLLVNFTLNMLLINSWGISGAALASMISYGLSFVLITIIFLHYRPANSVS